MGKEVSQLLVNMVSEDSSGQTRCETQNKRSNGSYPASENIEFFCEKYQ